jgi:hypothetical protein
MTIYYPNIVRSFAQERTKAEPTSRKRAWGDSEDDYDEDAQPTTHDGLARATDRAFQVGRLEEVGHPCEMMSLLFAHVLQDQEIWFSQKATPWQLLHLFLNMHHYLIYGDKEPDATEFRYYSKAFLPMLHWTFHHNIPHEKLCEMFAFIKSHPRQTMLLSLTNDDTYLSKLVNNSTIYKCECHNNTDCI